MKDLQAWSRQLRPQLHKALKNHMFIIPPDDNADIDNRQYVTVLGSTGSIGRSTLDVLRRNADRFRVYALTAATQVQLLTQQCAEFRPRWAAMSSPEHARELADVLRRNHLPTRVMDTPDALEQLAAHPHVQVVMGSIVGAAGLSPCMAAIAASKKLLLANKEALVMGGALFMRHVAAHPVASLIPVDSEHNAIFQCLPVQRAAWPQVMRGIILTASGGPFREHDPATLAHITPEQACRHPNFQMGRKISVDSATMMNKALEVIEARWLFDLAPEQIRVSIHPQQIVHSMAQMRDGSILAQLGAPDMRVPIAHALAWPARIDSGVEPLNFEQLASWTFEPPSRERFPGLFLAWDALRAPEGTTAVLNAANEVAVEAFLQRRLRFDRIHAVNAATLEQLPISGSIGCLQDLFELDTQARALAHAQVARFESA